MIRIGDIVRLKNGRGVQGRVEHISLDRVCIKGLWWPMDDLEVVEHAG